MEVLKDLEAIIIPYESTKGGSRVSKRYCVGHVLFGMGD
jgi:hypothetical protein